MDFIFILFFVIVGLILSGTLLKNEDKVHVGNLQILFIYHVLIGFAYYFYTKNGGGDAWGYWTSGKSLTPSQFWYYLVNEKSTYFVNALNYITANLLGMGYLANSMLYCLIGYVGIVFFYIIALQVIPYNSKLSIFKQFPLLFFLPNLHFWSSGVGKDSLILFCIGLFVYGLLKIGKRLPLILFSMLMIYLIRSHILLLLLLGFGLAYLINSKLNNFKRVIMSLLLITVAIAVIPSVMEATKIKEASVKSINVFSKTKVKQLSGIETGSSVNISSYPFPLKVFTFLYRPLFFDINGVLGLIASIENLLLLLISLQLLWQRPWRTFMASPFVIKGLIIFMILGTIVFSQSLGNLGIMIRMRNMLLPALILFIYWNNSFRIQERKSANSV